MPKKYIKITPVHLSVPQLVDIEEIVGLVQGVVTILLLTNNRSVGIFDDIGSINEALQRLERTGDAMLEAQ